ncbi:MAG: acetyl-CoA carboxylase biotin carboxylase subunit, partial [Haloechinothrix sp.]
LECRINAEAPERGFLPAPGRLERWVAPVGSAVRVDTHCYPGYPVPPYYDSLLAKVIVRGENRAAAIDRMEHALGHFTIEGVPSTIPRPPGRPRPPRLPSPRINTRWVEDVFIPAWAP